MPAVLIPVPDADIDRLIAEDVGFGDLTTSVLGIGSRPATIRCTARQPLVACATEEAARLLARLGATPSAVAPSGTVAVPGTLLLEATGSAAALHAGWKAAQTLVEWASGIASSVHAIRAAAHTANPRVVVACTRKVVPLTRALSIKAVKAGGGAMHRTGLSDTVLVFPEHRAFLTEDEAALIARLRAGAPERRLVVEVTDHASAVRFAAAGADVLQLEKFTPEAVAELVAAIAPLPHLPVVAAAGGVNVANAAAYAAAGADVLVTSAPYTAPPRDVQVRLSPAPD